MGNLFQLIKARMQPSTQYQSKTRDQPEMRVRFVPYEGTEPFIYANYARKDRNRVFHLLDALSKNGYRIWQDEGGIAPGEEWMRIIQDHIDRAEVCLLFWSEAATASRHCKAETAEMLSKGKKVITIHIDDTPLVPGLEIYLRQFQSIKLSEYSNESAFASFLNRESALSPCKSAPSFVSQQSAAPDSEFRTLKEFFLPDTTAQARQEADRILREAEQTRKEANKEAKRILREAERNRREAEQTRQEVEQARQEVEQARQEVEQARQEVERVRQNTERSNGQDTVSWEDTFTPYEGSEPYIFVSYVREEKERILPILEVMDRVGYRFWFDKGILGGDWWQDVLRDKARKCTIFLPFVSSAFNESIECGKELILACRDKKEGKIVPVFLDSVKKEALYPALQFLRDLQSLKWYECEDAVDFVDGSAEWKNLEPCLERWHREWSIRWTINTKGVLTIKKYEETQDSCSMHDYDTAWEKNESIGSTASWMKQRRDICTVVIQKGVHSIGTYAFKDCSRLTDATIPGSVAAIGGWAFEGCSGLTSVTIPDSVNILGDYVFSGCTGLTGVTILDSVTAMGDGIFNGCTGLTDVTLGRGITTISESSFNGCSGLKSITIPDSVTAIGAWAFKGCSDLESVTIPDSVTTIGNGAFYDCTNLKQVIIPAGAAYERSGEFASFPSKTDVVRRTLPGK